MTMTDNPITSRASLADHFGGAPAGPSTDYLGRIVFVSVFEGNTDLDKVTQVLADLDLAGFAPKRTAKSDIFRKVTNEANRRTQIDLNDGKYAKVMVRKVSDDEKEILRRLVIEVVDAKGKQLSYESAFDLAFDRDHTAKAEKRTPAPRFKVRDLFAPLDPAAAEAARNVAYELRSEYTKRDGTVDAAALRATVNKALGGASAISVRKTGGAFFVPEANAEATDKLKALSVLIPQVDIWVLPLIDTPEQRAKIEAALNDDVAAEVAKIEAEMAEMVAEGNVSKRRMATLLAEHAEVTARADEYRGVLSKELSTLKDRMTMLGHQVVQLSLRAS